VRALVIDGPKSARVRQVDAPVPGPRQVVVDVHRVGICGTDIELFTGELPYFAQGKIGFPLRPGHEWCGVVSAVGPGVDQAWLGERVTGDTMLGCGHCRRCESGHHHVCADRHEIGILGWPGALADKVLVPAGSLYRLPATVDDRAGALVEPGGNAWRAAAAGAGPGTTVLVCGPGTIGLLTTAFTRATGAEVHVLGVDERPASLAASFGASRYWTLSDPPSRTYDAVIDCTGNDTVPALALRYVEPAGRLVYIGVSGKPSVIDSRELVLNDVTAVGILGASAGLAAAIEHYADGRVDPGALVHVVVGLDRAAEAFEGRLDPGPGTKVHVDPRVLPLCQNWPMASDAPRDATAGVVRSFSADEGWGVIDAPEVPGGCFVHFSVIQMPGYRELRAGQRVRFTCESPGQDGCAYTALAVWPAS
jgi:2-desacetyl-2-hydroxyethyl bacteriochlorophyllide A dehydrogenase